MRISPHMIHDEVQVAIGSALTELEIVKFNGPFAYSSLPDPSIVLPLVTEAVLKYLIQRGFLQADGSASVVACIGVNMAENKGEPE